MTTHDSTGALTVFDRAARISVSWLDAHQVGMDARVLKLVEEAGETAAAWIGHRGSNPRKGTTHTVADVAAEAADVACAALVLLHSLPEIDPAAVLSQTAAKVTSRATASAPARGRVANCSGAQS